MRLTDISLNNLRRRKGKVFFLVLGLVMGVATIVSMVSLTQAMRADMQDKLDRFGANIIITPKSDEVSLSYGGIFVASTTVNTKDMKVDDVAKVSALADAYGISNIAPKLVGGVQVNGAKALLVGVDFDAELGAKKWWEITGSKPKDSGEVLLGALASKKFSAMPGGKLTINGSEFSVAGVLRETGAQEDAVIFVELAKAQQILGKPNALTFVEVSASSRNINALLEQLGTALPTAKAAAMRDAMKSTQQRVDQLTNFSIAVSIVVLLVGVLIVLTTMMSSVKERTREIGIFRATGFRKSHIMTIILFEALVISVVGGISGWLIGSAVTFAAGPRIAQISSGIGPSPFLAIAAILLSVLIGMAGAIYPALRASNMDPSEALRFA